MNIAAEISRRTWLAGAAGAVAWTALPRPSAFAADEPAKLPVAVATTVYRKNSHSDVIVGKILEGWKQDGGPGPGLKLTAMYVDQYPANDLSRGLAEKHGFRLAKTIDEAITQGTDCVQVAGVLSVAEHGDYPETPDTKQHEYPRRRFFEEIAATFRRCGQVVPVFNDKHLAYRWQDAKFMFDTAREMKIPLLAGSSIPVGGRQPAGELPLGAEIEAAVGVGYGGAEAYGFHALEGLECFIERRKGGESGVAKVRAVSGDEIRRTQAAGLWSGELFAAALATLPKSPVDSDKWLKKGSVYLMEHRDGLKSAVVMANGLAADFACTVKIKGRTEPLAVRFHLQEGAPFMHFAYLVHAFEQTVRTGKPAYPAERTLLTTGVLDRAMHSLAKSGESYDTPELAIAYQGADWPYANRADSKLQLKIE